MRPEHDVLVIGAGAAGLAAARELDHHELRVVVLEARARLGGRILTLRDGGLPLELGAEFVHGSRRALTQLVPEMQLETEQIEERHYYREHGGLRLRDDLGDVLSSFAEAARQKRLGAVAVRDALRETGRSTDEIRLVSSYVSGLHAADPDRYATAQLFEQEPSTTSPSGTELHRVTGGYDRLIEALAADLDETRARIVTHAVVERIVWAPDQVVALTRSAGSFSARAAIVTLPLGVLLSGDVVFEPTVERTLAAAQGLGVGSVVRALLELERPIWDDDRFVHDPELAFPTFWPTGPRGSAGVVGWASARAADALARASEAELRTAAIRSLSALSGAPVSRIESELVRFAVKDWQADPFSRGAYSYGLAGFRDPWQRLAEPIDGTLFFAGEATDTEGHDATVQGALASGRRAAEQVKNRVESRARRDRRR